MRTNRDLAFVPVLVAALATGASTFLGQKLADNSKLQEAQKQQSKLLIGIFAAVASLIIGLFIVKKYKKT